MTNVVNMKAKRVRREVGSDGRDWWKEDRKPGEETVVRKRRKLGAKYLRIRDWAERLACGVDTIYDAIHEGELEADPIGKRGYRVSEEAMEEYINRTPRKAR